MNQTLYEEVVSRGIPHAHHESDLYIPDTQENRELVIRSGSSCTSFDNRVDGGRWLDIPFAYTPWWESRATKQTNPNNQPAKS